MAFYEYVCQECGAAFEMRRSMADADRAVSCPDGHSRVRRKLSVFASVGAAPDGSPSMSAAGGGCCGGSCGCAH